ncbi:MAG: aldehyde dehydrogenase family protein, partial [Specibacter sp.]
MQQHIRPGMRIYDEDIFESVLAVLRVDDYAQETKLANSNCFTNGTAIFARKQQSNDQGFNLDDCET